MSGKVAIQKSTLEAIGEALRNKEGSTDLIPVNTLADRIAALPSATENKFKDCLNRTLTEVTAEDLEGVTALPQYIFNGCPIKKITIPNTIKTFGTYAFQAEEMWFTGEPWEWCSIKKDSGNFNFNKGKLYIKGEPIENLDITPTNEMLTGTCHEVFISARTFFANTDIKTVKLRNAGEIYVIGNYAFAYCSNLTRVEMASEQVNTSLGNTEIKKELGSSLFSYCPNLTDIYVSWSEGVVKNAPWGATNATIHYDTPVDFYVDDKQYLTSTSMTWAQWCDSEFNTDGFYIDTNDSNYVKNANGEYVTKPSWKHGPLYNETKDTYLVRGAYYYRTEA